jgi:hypothetical protein
MQMVVLKVVKLVKYLAKLQVAKKVVQLDWLVGWMVELLAKLKAEKMVL